MKITVSFTPLNNCKVCVHTLPVGYYTRKYIHNYYSRKQYLEGLKTKNLIVRYCINCSNSALSLDPSDQNIFHPSLQTFAQERIRSMENKFRTRKRNSKTKGRGGALARVVVKKLLFCEKSYKIRKVTCLRVVPG